MKGSGTGSEGGLKWKEKERIKERVMECGKENGKIMGKRERMRKGRKVNTWKEIEKRRKGGREKRREGDGKEKGDGKRGRRRKVEIRKE